MIIAIFHSVAHYFRTEHEVKEDDQTKIQTRTKKKEKNNKQKCITDQLLMLRDQKIYLH